MRRFLVMFAVALAAAGCASTPTTSPADAPAAVPPPEPVAAQTREPDPDVSVPPAAPAMRPPEVTSMAPPETADNPQRLFGNCDAAVGSTSESASDLGVAVPATAPIVVTGWRTHFFDVADVAIGVPDSWTEEPVTSTPESLVLGRWHHLANGVQHTLTVGCLAGQVVLPDGDRMPPPSDDLETVVTVLSDRFQSVSTSGSTVTATSPAEWLQLTSTGGDTVLMHLTVSPAPTALSDAVATTILGTLGVNGRDAVCPGGATCRPAPADLVAATAPVVR